MADTDTLNPYPQATTFLAGFNRYGLPGTVIGALFFLVAVMLYFVLTTFQANTKAMVEMSSALTSLKETIKECK